MKDNETAVPDKLHVLESESVNKSENSNESNPSSICEKQFWTIEPDLFPFKAFYFSGNGAIGALMPLLALYFKQIGFSPYQIGFISGLRPLIAFFGSPLCGILAGRFRISKILLLIGLLGWASFFLAIGLTSPPKMSSEHCNVQHGLNSSKGGNNFSSRPVDMQVNRGVSYFESLQENRYWMFDDIDMSRVFVTIVCLTIFGELVLTPTHALSDSGCIEHLGARNIHKYGVQRCWGAFGFGLFGLVSGSVVSTTRKIVTVCGIDIVVSNYHLAFYIFVGLVGLAFVAACFFKFPNESKARNTDPDKVPNVQAAFKLFASLHYSSWLLCIAFMGHANGIIWGFLNWHLENIGATQFLIGVGNVVNSVSEIIMFAVIFLLLKKIGHTNLIFIGLVSYIVRFLAYGLMYNPWTVLPFESLQGFTFAGVWSAQLGYLCTAIPMDAVSTMQGILHGVYWGLGSGTGFMLGGVLVQTYGARNTFLAMAVACSINLVVFFIVQKFCKKPDIKENYEELKN